VGQSWLYAKIVGGEAYDLPVEKFSYWLHARNLSLKTGVHQD